MELALSWPRSRAELDELQSRRKRLAVERAMRAPFYAGKLDGIDLDALDDPAVWARIPILEKEELRAMSAESFYRDFCNVERTDIAEYWRSGGTTGKPLFYPRTHEDIRHAMVGFTRTFECMGIGPGDIAHVSFPLGIHPVGQMWSRAAELMGVGAAWAGAGAAAPSSMQLDIMRMLKPSVWMGMSSYGLHLANLAEAQGLDLADFSVEKICCSAEPLSMAKREKLERDWGAKVYDGFGMTECSMMASEAGSPGELYLWTDLAFVEVLDPQTDEPVPAGQAGKLVMTSLFTNNGTPFLRWSSGDLIEWYDEGSSDGPWSVFPVIRHTHRTAGFFKVRGVNLAHAELEDYLFANASVNDFKAEAVATGGLDELRLHVELARTVSRDEVVAGLQAEFKLRFEVTPHIEVLPTGTLAREFEASVKAPRFVDRR